MRCRQFYQSLRWPPSFSTIMVLDISSGYTPNTNSLSQCSSFNQANTYTRCCGWNCRRRGHLHRTHSPRFRYPTDSGWSVRRTQPSRACRGNEISSCHGNWAGYRVFRVLLSICSGVFVRDNAHYSGTWYALRNWYLNVSSLKCFWHTADVGTVVNCFMSILIGTFMLAMLPPESQGNDMRPSTFTSY